MLFKKKRRKLQKRPKEKKKPNKDAVEKSAAFSFSQKLHLLLWKKRHTFKEEITMFNSFKNAFVNFMMAVNAAFDRSYNDYDCWDEAYEYERFWKTNMGLH